MRVLETWYASEGLGTSYFVSRCTVRMTSIRPAALPSRSPMMLIHEICSQRSRRWPRSHPTNVADGSTSASWLYRPTITQVFSFRGGVGRPGWGSGSVISRQIEQNGFYASVQSSVVDSGRVSLRPGQPRRLSLHGLQRISFATAGFCARPSDQFTMLM